MTKGLNFPTSLTRGADGAWYVAESGLPMDGAPNGGRVWRLQPDGGRSLVVDGLRAPVTGLTSDGDSFLLSEGGAPSRISRLDVDGAIRSIVDGLPGPGDYHVSMALRGPDGRIWFGQGAMTNSGIVGLDSFRLAWLQRLPAGQDLPGYDVTLTGVNAESADPRSPGLDARTNTGAFAPFGTPGQPGERVMAGLPATAAVMCCHDDGSGLELVAWGIRNPFGLLFLPDGRLLATDQGADDRGSRPVGGAPDILWEVRRGAWYGWPDYVGGRPVTDSRFVPTRGPAPVPLIADHHLLPPVEQPLLTFPTHSAATKMDIGPAHAGAWTGQVAVALFGDEAPMTTPPGPPVGRTIARVDPQSWTVDERLDGPWERPIDVRFDPAEPFLYVLDFGRFEMTEHGPSAKAGSGAVWRVRL